MELVFINSSNDIISRELDDIPPNNKEVSGYIEPKKKVNDSNMELCEDASEDTEVDANIKSNTCSESMDNEGLGNKEPDLKETLPPED